MELQRGNWLAALMLLERSVRMDPRLQPVLNWTQVGKGGERGERESEGAVLNWTQVGRGGGAGRGRGREPLRGVGDAPARHSVGAGRA